MRELSIFPAETRLGFHYFPDSVHYREADLRAWLPQLVSLGARWLTLIAPIERAIPDFFLDGLIGAGIQPILHFQLPTSLSPDPRDMQTLLEHYARWGVRHAALYDRPNCQTNWLPAIWAQVDLVERFLDVFIPQAEMVRKLGMTPILSPLEPGGDYWDLAFLRTALRSMQRRGSFALLDTLTLGAYAWVGDRPLNWGAGGAARWPEARPYCTADGGEDHLGFRIFDWYLEIARQELGGNLPIILLRTGSCPIYDESGALLNGMQHAFNNLALAQLAMGYPNSDEALEPLPPEMLACNFWLLAADERCSCSTQAWFLSDGGELPVVDAIRRWVASLKDAGRTVDATQRAGVGFRDHLEQAHVNHYVLLPLYSWGAAEWDLAAIQPLLRDSHPTIGFSLVEASRAQRVTVVGGSGAYSPEALQALRAAGCRVERLLEDGTLVAT